MVQMRGLSLVDTLETKNCTMKMVDPRSLKPYDRNSKIHSPESIKELADSMAAVGFNRSVSVDENGSILAGHKSVLAAIYNIENGREGFDTIPILVPKNLTDTQRRAFILAENKHNDKSDWDFDMVSAELDFLQSEDFDIELTGFDDGFILDENYQDEYFDEEEDEYEEDERPGDEDKKYNVTTEGMAQFAMVMEVEDRQTVVKAVNREKELSGLDGPKALLAIVLRGAPK